jgi:hypothetical protein
MQLQLDGQLRGKGGTGGLGAQFNLHRPLSQIGVAS